MMTAQTFCYLESLENDALLSQWSVWKDSAPGGGVLALLPEAEKDRLPLLQETARRSGMPLVGAIFPALVVDGRFVTRGVQLLHFVQQPPVALIPLLNAGPDSPEDKIVAAIRPRLQTGAATLFMIFDGMVPNIATILDGVYLQLANRVLYAGVNAGSETFQPMPCLFDSEQVVGDGVLCLLLPDHPGAALEHGYKAPDEVITATSTEGNRIISIDWRPAFDIYRERVEAAYGVDITAENFYQHAVHFPFGIVLANDDILVRIPVALQDDGSLFCVGEIPANAMLTLLQSPQVDSSQTVDQLLRNVASLRGAAADRGDLLAFYCAGRRMHLGNAAEQELALLKERSGARHMVGALSLGEIGALSHRGYPQFHNATLVVTPWQGS